MNGPRRILIVDDEPNVRLMFRTALTTGGDSAMIGEAEDSEAALEQIAQNPYDMILLDLRMAGIDGMETLRRLRERGDNTPVAVVTAHGDVPHAVAAMKLGAVDFLVKPLTPDTLRRVVGEVCDRARRAESSPDRHGAGAVTAADQFAQNMARAKVAISRRDLDSAATHLKLALALKGDSAEAQNLMGVLLEVRDDHEGAYKAYRNALKADPTYEPARQNMTRARELYAFGRSSTAIHTGDA